MSVDSAAEEQFGPYAVYERLGVGGMATVHRALEHNPDSGDRIVALKRLLPHLAEDASFIKSFVREAKLASILNHVNIVQIYELGRVGTEYFISMEYIDGRDVRRLLRHARKVTGPPPIYVAVGLMLQLCEALDYAHNKVDEDGHPLGLVHRDISPSNLIVTSQGHLKIIDFGIAKAQSSQLRTQTGRVKGKLAYMAPEAISGSRDLDARSDIWATGVILHELLTARPLFASKNEYQTLLKVQKGDILPPSTFNQACPPELDAIVFKALARSADARYANAAEMREDLLELKRQYALKTSYRDVASWIDWAFGLEAPGGFSGDTSGVISIPSQTAPPVRNSDEEEAVEVVWGSGAEQSEDGPVVLDEVPDVSHKPRARRDTEDEHSVDDIPTPLPSHGTLPSIYGAGPEVPVLPPREPRLPPHTIEPSALGRGTDRPKPTAAAAMIPPIKPATRPVTGTMPVVPMPARTTGPMPVVPLPGKRITGMHEVEAVRTRKPTTGVQAIVPPPATTRPSDRLPAASVPRASDRMPASAPPRVDTPQLADRLSAQRARDSVAPPVSARPARADSASDTSTSNPFTEDPETNAYVPGTRDTTESPPLRPSLTEEELFGNDAADVLRSVSAQLDAMATQPTLPKQDDDAAQLPREMRPSSAPLPSVPVVRFSKSHAIPQVDDTSSGRISVPPGATTPLPATPTFSDSRPPQTKPGFAPVPVSAIPRTGGVRPSTPSKPPSNVIIPAPTQTVLEPKKRTALVVVGGILLAAGAATAVVLALSSGNDAAPAADSQGVAAPPPAPVAPEKLTGTVKFQLQPADAEIKIEGAVVHTGSPWSSELPAGIHQIEIHKQGYKSWLTSLELSANETHTMRVVLEPITSVTAQEDATLTIATTPEGLDVEIDGTPFAGKTPIKTTLKVGTHEISVKQNGVEVWRQTVKAEAASDYEFNPSFTDQKKRERAQRATTAPRPTPAPARAIVPTEASAPAAAEAGSADAAAPAEPAAAEPEPAPAPAPAPSGPRPPITSPL